MLTQLKSPRTELPFGDTGASVTVAAPALTADRTYTLIVYNLFFDPECHSAPCPPLVVNLGSPQQGHHSLTFPSPFNAAGVENTAPQFSPIWQFIRN
jgi:hypothetical protein